MVSIWGYGNEAKFFNGMPDGPLRLLAVPASKSALLTVFFEGEPTEFNEKLL